MSTVTVEVSIIEVEGPDYLVTATRIGGFNQLPLDNVFSDLKLARLYAEGLMTILRLAKINVLFTYQPSQPVYTPQRIKVQRYRHLLDPRFTATYTVEGVTRTMTEVTRDQMRPYRGFHLVSRGYYTFIIKEGGIVWNLAAATRELTADEAAMIMIDNHLFKEEEHEIVAVAA